MENWGIHHSKISAYNHKGNGKVETIHGAVKNIMRAFMRKFENDWDLLLPMVEFAYNTQVHSTMGYKPFTLQFGRAPTYPIDITLQTSNPELVTPDEYAKMVHERMAEIFQIVNEKRQESEESLWITVCAEGSKSPSFAVKIFDEIAKTNKMIPKQTIRKAPPKGKREVKQPKFKYPVLQVFYDGSGHVDPHIGGAGYVIIKEGLEVGGGFETIPLGSNNLGEFSGCLAGLQQVIGFGQRVEMVGDCKILTEAAPKMKPIDNFELNEILSEIRNIAESKFAKVEYTHVYREFNKRSDAIATAASHSKEDGMEAVFDRNWDPRSKQLATTSEEWIIENSKLWKWVMEPLDLDWSFPVKKVQFKRRFKDKVITTNNVYFPVQAALDGVMISPVFISDDIVKWFPERAAPGEMLESFVEKENRKWREEYEQARNHWLKSAMRPSIVRKIIRPIKAVEKKRILKEIRMRNRKKH